MKAFFKNNNEAFNSLNLQIVMIKRILLFIFKIKEGHKNEKQIGAIL